MIQPLKGGHAFVARFVYNFSSIFLKQDAEQLIKLLYGCGRNVLILVYDTQSIDNIISSLETIDSSEAHIGNIHVVLTSLSLIYVPFHL